jgi:hypothetical protein
MPVAREWLGKRHVTAGRGGDRGNTTIEELWEEEFFMQSVPQLYKKEQLHVGCEPQGAWRQDRLIDG